MNILLVEDDPGIGRFVTKGLTAEGWNVHWLRQGEAAVATANPPKTLRGVQGKIDERFLIQANLTKAGLRPT